MSVVLQLSSLTLGAFTYNLLRLIGLETLKKDDAPISRKNQRRRIKTVIKNMIYLDVRLVHHARSVFLKFSRYCRWFTTKFWERFLTTQYFTWMCPTFLILSEKTEGQLTAFPAL
ncbi:hypothetical protein [Anoxynatronum sibiricum]|uniref:hypothetical protein n=1 Tax=Anoxynatronum sibiricum TaxID=210623 RepID=UPI0031B82A16